MSKEKSSSPESSNAPSAGKAGEHRTAKGRAGKNAKSSRQTAEEPAVEKSPSAFPVSDQTEDAPGGVGEAAESVVAGEASPTEVAKRKRRRKKGKGGGSQAATAELSPEPGEETPVPAPPPHPAQTRKSKLDPDKVDKLALKIYLAEVSEEGVALIGDSDAKELSRRCFRLAEIFVEEQTRRR